MSATELIEQFQALPASERAQVAKFVVENDDSWIPESFKQGMADAEAGRFVDLDTALNKPYPGDKWNIGSARLARSGVASQNCGRSNSIAHVRRLSFSNKIHSIHARARA